MSDLSFVASPVERGSPAPLGRGGITVARQECVQVCHVALLDWHPLPSVIVLLGKGCLNAACECLAHSARGHLRRYE